MTEMDRTHEMDRAHEALTRTANLPERNPARVFVVAHATRILWPTLTAEVRTRALQDLRDRASWMHEDGNQGAAEACAVALQACEAST